MWEGKGVMYVHILFFVDFVGWGRRACVYEWKS